MYPAVTDMDAVHSGTGVFYQAMPAVGADGKNIMKLIPVQIDNGQFFQTQISKPRMDPAPHKAATINIASAPVHIVKKAAFNPFATQQVCRKPVSFVNASSNHIDLYPRNSLNKHPLQQQAVKLMAKLPPMATPATNCEKSVRLPSQLPVTVKSPALPIGQYLQIPPNAQVRTVPVSELPPVIKKQIFTSPVSSSPGSGLPNVVYVSPITTVNQSVTPPSDSAPRPLKLLSRTSSKTSCGLPSKGSKPHLKLIPKFSQRPNSPIKWIIEEEDSSSPPTLDPLSSPSVTSEILWAVAERENASKHCDVITKQVSQSSLGEGGQGQENALVMCNGKVFFVSKKRNLTLEMGESDRPTLSPKCYEFNKTMVSSSQQSPEPVAPEIEQDLKIIIPDESEEVIDLCDDDAQDDPSQQAASVNTTAQVDEDNVIFVSYIPPKSESAQDLILKTQSALVKQKGTSSSNRVTEQKSLDGTTGSDGRDEVSPHRGRKPGQSTLVSTDENHTHIGGSAVVNMPDNEGSDINSQQGNPTQQLDSMEVNVETERPADPSSGICSGIEKNTHKTESSINSVTSWTSLPAPKPCQMSDHLLRRMFRITADARICLQRIDEAPSWLKEKELFLQDVYSLQETDSDKLGLNNVRRWKVLTGQEVSADPHTHTGPLKCSHFKLNTKPLSALKCHSGQNSLKGTSHDVETELVIGYVEPIDEDFLSTDENVIPSSQDTDARPQTATCVDLNTNTRRVGRTRKRTMCPCCIPGTQYPAVKSSTKSIEPEKWARTTEQTSRKGGKQERRASDGGRGSFRTDETQQR
ncbi:ligand-dependent nuclear receptor-interacting factor 1 [Morone saxatilis]|uniref:ligand-dependent nuclear receptor-interacting factor 1 n=1 Tax=Morone saxatilis TaxID=34816 RepID=UPI0015E23776|nr:ligand-dependent nuclear receptor-interacting factor 1 [Morone saxatilis]